MRFNKKERHQVFLEPEGADTDEVYVQGMSSSLPHDVQKAMYRSVTGLERAEIMRYAYAIEYDCIDPLDILPTMESKKVSGLYTAGQINGTSGYEEAAAQGLVAGINASFKLLGREPLVIGRDEGYIGVLIDDLVTKGTDEPYRIMTSRAEWSLLLRHDLADFRLTPKIMGTPLYTDERRSCFERRKTLYEKALSKLDEKISDRSALKGVLDPSVSVSQISTYADLVRRGADIERIAETFSILPNVPRDILKSAETTIKYEGYIEKSRKNAEKAKRLEERKIPDGIDYEKIGGLRLEAREKLQKIRPRTLGQAERIPGVNPADVTVLMVYLGSDDNRRKK